MMDPLRSETCWSTFKYFIILILSKYYILCISWIIKCLTTVLNVDGIISNLVVSTRSVPLLVSTWAIMFVFS